MNQFQAADVAIGLFDPVRAKATNGDMYKGYDVVNGMKSRSGAYRFRSMKVLKNSFGVDNVTFGMKFLGEVNYFETLPVPKNKEPAELAEWEAKMAVVYATIKAGK